MSELAVALRFAEAGFAIIPVRLFRDGDRLRKRPHIKAWRERASTDVEVVAGWWREWPEAVPGIVLAHSGLVVVDCDRHVGGADGVAAFAALGPFELHPIVRTPSGGEHHYFRQPEASLGGGPFADGIDVLGTSRFVVAPGAAGYELVVDGDKPVLPEVFRTVEQVGLRSETPRGCGPIPRVLVSPNSREGRYARAALKNAFAKVAEEPRGRRAWMLNKQAFKIGGMVANGWIAGEVAVKVLMLGARSNGLQQEGGEEQCRAMILCGLEAGMQFPYPELGAWDGG